MTRLLWTLLFLALAVAGAAEVARIAFKLIA
jgi:hypothetical protein